MTERASEHYIHLTRAERQKFAETANDSVYKCNNEMLRDRTLYRHGDVYTIVESNTGGTFKIYETTSLSSAIYEWGRC